MTVEPRSRMPLYVIGHKNPDTDAICAAIGNAEFLRAHGYPEARAARCGELLPRTEWVLEKAGAETPEYIPDVTPTASDIGTRNVISVLPSDTFLTAYNLMTKHNFNSIPVVDENGELHGILRFLDLLNLLMPSQVTDMSVRTVVACLKNIAQTIDAECLTEAPLSEHDHEIILLVGASSEPTIRTRLANFKAKGMAHKLLVICGDRPNVQLFAIEAARDVVVRVANQCLTANRTYLGESGVFLNLDSPTLIVGQVKVEAVELELSHLIDELQYKVFGHEVAANVEHSTAVRKAGGIVDRHSGEFDAR